MGKIKETCEECQRTHPCVCPLKQNIQNNLHDFWSSYKHTVFKTVSFAIAIIVLCIILAVRYSDFSKMVNSGFTYVVFGLFICLLCIAFYDYGMVHLKDKTKINLIKQLNVIEQIAGLLKILVPISSLSVILKIFFGNNETIAEYFYGVEALISSYIAVLCGVVLLFLICYQVKVKNYLVSFDTQDNATHHPEA